MSTDPYLFDPAAFISGAPDCERCGRDACAGDCGPPVAARPRPGEPAGDSRKLDFLTVDEVLSLPRPEAVIEGIAWRQQQTVLVGESGAGKTFVAASACAAVADGRPTWCGRRVRGGPVAYLGFEADDFASRFQAEREHGSDLARFYFARPSEPLSPRVGRDGIETYSAGELAAREALRALQQRAGEPLALVVIDTVRRAMTGSDSDDSQVAAFLRAVSRVMVEAPQAACMSLHHSGWVAGDPAKKRERGSSVWRGNSDAVLYLESVGATADRSEVRLELSTLKVRNVAQPPPLHLVRRRVYIEGFDEFGDPRTSCIVERDPRSHSDRQAEAEAAKQSEADKVLLEVLEVIRDHAPKNRDELRARIRARKSTVSDRLTDALRLKLVTEGRRGDPFRLTDEGLERLAEAAE